MQYFDHNLFPPSAPPRSFPTSLQSFLPSRWLGKTEIFGISRIVQKRAILHLFLKLKKKKVHQKKLKKTSFCNRERTDYHYSPSPFVMVYWPLLSHGYTVPLRDKPRPLPTLPFCQASCSPTSSSLHTLSLLSLSWRGGCCLPPHTPPLSLSPP